VCLTFRVYAEDPYLQLYARVLNCHSPMDMTDYPTMFTMTPAHDSSSSSCNIWGHNLQGLMALSQELLRSSSPEISAPPYAGSILY
jgi:hypothetical protein